MSEGCLSGPAMMKVMKELKALMDSPPEGIEVSRSKQHSAGVERNRSSISDMKSADTTDTRALQLLTRMRADGRRPRSPTRRSIASGAEQRRGLQTMLGARRLLAHGCIPDWMDPFLHCAAQTWQRSACPVPCTPSAGAKPRRQLLTV